MRISNIEVETQVLFSPQGRNPESFLVPEENETQKVLRRALEVLGPNGEHWYQGSRCDSTGTMYCAIGAIHMAVVGHTFDYPEGVSEPRMALCKTLPENITTATWNDDPSRTFPEVREMFLRAIQLAATSAPARSLP